MPCKYCDDTHSAFDPCPESISAHLTERSGEGVQAPLPTPSGWIRVEFEAPPIPARDFDWHAWIDGDEEWGTFHAPTKYEALERLAEALAERFYSQPSTTGCAQCGRVVQVKP
jgi:hypothetical protein